jgi:hypothetical protein
MSAYAAREILAGMVFGLPYSARISARSTAHRLHGAIDGTPRCRTVNRILTGPG